MNNYQNKILILMGFIVINFGCTQTKPEEPVILYSRSKRPAYDVQVDCQSRCQKEFGTDWHSYNWYEDGKLRECFCE